MNKGYKFSPTILREYDIRGQIGKNLSHDDAYALGLAFGTRVIKNGGTRICVGYDGRNSSIELEQALTRGLIKTGIDVDIIGLGPSPLLYFTVKDRLYPSGIMITGSHNPADYNGFKMMDLKSPVFGEEIQRIGRIAENKEYIISDTEGKVRNIEVKDIYLKRIMKSLTKTDKKLKIAWDCGNGASGELMRSLVKLLPHESILLYDEIDGTFPNHHPDPTVDKNLIDLQKSVLDNNCDLGIAFDGDADRIGAIDEKGNILRCDNLMALYAEEVLETFKGASIIGDVKCSQVMFDHIKKSGGNPIMWNTGHSLIKSKMIEENSPLAGELSGHIFFNDKFYGFDDAIYNAIRLINIMTSKGSSLNELSSKIPKLHNTPEIRFEVIEEEKFEIVERIKEKASKQDYASIDTIDGVRVNKGYGWWLLRASNTQNVLVTRAEANNNENLDKIKIEIENLLATENIEVNWNQ